MSPGQELCRISAYKSHTHTDTHMGLVFISPPLSFRLAVHKTIRGKNLMVNKRLLN